MHEFDVTIIPAGINAWYAQSEHVERVIAKDRAAAIRQVRARICENEGPHGNRFRYTARRAVDE